jgi:hypothetical protein
MIHVIKSAALALLSLVLLVHARANEPKVITLSCEGTLIPTYGASRPEAAQPLPRTGVVVNLDAQTVFFLGYVAPIHNVRYCSRCSRDPTNLHSAHPDQGDCLVDVQRRVALQFSELIDVNSNTRKDQGRKRHITPV